MLIEAGSVLPERGKKKGGCKSMRPPIFIFIIKNKSIDLDTFIFDYDPEPCINQSGML